MQRSSSSVAPRSVLTQISGFLLKMFLSLVDIPVVIRRLHSLTFGQSRCDLCQRVAGKRFQIIDVANGRLHSFRIYGCAASVDE
jgi:hypothetical protein